MAKKDKFDYFAAFVQQAEFACQEAAQLRSFVEGDSFDEQTVELFGNKMHQVEHDADQINHGIFAAVATEFITPIEREDIISLAQNLDDVVDCIEDVMQRFYMYNVTEMHPVVKEAVLLIERICSALLEAVQEFRNFHKSKTLGQLLVTINDLEEEGDRLYLDSTRSLYAQHRDDTILILTWNNIFNRIEHVCDACEHVSDTIGTIIMKNS